jgi:acetyl esterase/lipase
MKRRELGRALLGGALWLGCGGPSAGHPDAAPGATRERVRYGSAPSQIGDLLVPAGAGKHPIAIVIHGGFWMSAYGLDLMTPLCDDLARAGVATWNIEYRRVGEPDGGWPGTLLDVGAAADRLRVLAASHPIDLGRVVTIGHSAGGQLALWLAGRSRLPDGDPLHVASPLAVRGAISLAGVVDLRRGFELGLGGGAVGALLGGGPTEVSSRYASASPADLLPLGVPQRLFHGALDSIVPLALSEAYVAHAKERGDTAVLSAPSGVGHFEPIDPSSGIWTEIRAELIDMVR